MVPCRNRCRSVGKPRRMVIPETGKMPSFRFVCSRCRKCPSGVNVSRFTTESSRLLCKFNVRSKTFSPKPELPYFKANSRWLRRNESSGPVRQKRVGFFFEHFPPLSMKQLKFNNAFTCWNHYSFPCVNRGRSRGPLPPALTARPHSVVCSNPSEKGARSEGLIIARQILRYGPWEDPSAVHPGRAARIFRPIFFV